MSVTGLELKYTGLRIVYVPFWHVPLTIPLRWSWRSRSRTRRIEDNARTSPDVWKTVNWQDNSDKKRPVHQHPSYLLGSLTRERDRRRTARRHLASASSFAISHPIGLFTCSAWGTWCAWCACVYLVIVYYPKMCTCMFSYLPGLHLGGWAEGGVCPSLPESVPRLELVNTAWGVRARLVMPAPKLFNRQLLLPFLNESQMYYVDMTMMWILSFFESCRVFRTSCTTCWKTVHQWPQKCLS